MKHTHLYILVVALLTGACEEETPKNTLNSINQSLGWLVPVDEVVSGGITKDGIISLINPNKKRADDPVHSYLDNDDLVLGFKMGDSVFAYPHSVLDYHEIINDRAAGVSITVTYCPLTGTGIAWDRVLEGEETTFGVSGLLYNANLIPYDRKTNSNWSQIQMQCINGELIGTKPLLYHLIEMPWGKWKSMYPESKVVSAETPYGLRYQKYPYGDYKTSSSFVVTPVNRSYRDLRLDFKERVLAIIMERRAKVYRFESFGENLSLINDRFMDQDLIIAGIRDSYMIAYNAEIEPGLKLDFSPLPNQNDIIMQDQEGNEWNVFGEAVTGPRKGQKLESLTSFMAYWFSVPAFFPEPLIYE